MLVDTNVGRGAGRGSGRDESHLSAPRQNPACAFAHRAPQNRLVECESEVRPTCVPDVVEGVETTV